MNTKQWLNLVEKLEFKTRMDMKIRKPWVIQTGSSIKLYAFPLLKTSDLPISERILSVGHGFVILNLRKTLYHIFQMIII